ncbi:O-antigen ligase family protein [Vibrio scophthalmi]|uniref:O-antigen ligase family protein n=1 Tax=Vibrio scophthalmi TaxID=45658 RepID=UPI003EBADEED
MIKINESNLKSVLSSKYYDLFMFSSCIVYCFLAMPDFAAGDVFKNIILFGTAPVLYYYCKESNSDKKIVWLFIFSVLIQLASWINSLFVIPYAAKSLPEIKLLANLFLFIPIAFWIGNNSRRRAVLFTTLIVGFIFSIAYDNYYNDSLQLGLLGKRVDFGLYNAQFTTMISAIVIMISSYLLTTNKTINKKLAYTIFTLITALSLFSFIISQSRQVWVATLILISLLPIIARSKINRKAATVFYIVLSIMITAVFNTNIVQHRLSGDGDSQTVSKILSLNWENIPMTSFGIRFNSWLEASEWIKDNPIIGASKEGVRQVLKTSERFQSTPATSGFGHLHNYYLETLVAFGIVGAFFLICFYTIISQNIFKHANYPTAVFYICFLIFWLIINNFESYNSKHYGIYIQSIILGSMFFIPKPKFMNHHSHMEKAVSSQHKK